MKTSTLRRLRITRMGYGCKGYIRNRHNALYINMFGVAVTDYTDVFNFLVIYLKIV